MTKKTSQGGKREGAGRKLKYGEPTKKVQVRMPESKVDVIKTRINEEILKDYLVNKEK